jgi:hypothetical protein
MANPDANGHQAAITSRPLLLTSVGRLTTTGGQNALTITSQHCRSNKVRQWYQQLNAFFDTLMSNAPQLISEECWARILAKVVERILPKGGIGPPNPMLSSS